MKTSDILLSSFIWIYLAALSHEVKATDPAIEITGDGNCWFRALSFCCQGNEDGHHHLRQEITVFMWQQRDLYRRLIRHEGDINLFIINQRNDRVYAEGITLQASADFLGMDLYVTIHHDGTEVITYWIRPSGNQHTTTNWLHVRQSGENHFDVIGSSNRNVGVRPDENTRLWYDDVSDHDRPRTVHHNVDNMKEDLKVHEERKEEDIVSKEEETKERGDTVGEDDLDLIMKNLDLRAGTPVTTDENQVTDTDIDLKAKVKLKLPKFQLNSEIDKGWTIQDEESEDSDYYTPPVSPTEEKNTELEFKTPPQSPVENVEKLSDLFVELDVGDSELTDCGADKEDNVTGDIVVNEVVESMPDEVDGKTQVDINGDNNKKDNSDNPVYKEIGSIADLVEQSTAGGLSWTHLKVYRKFWDFHHHFLVVNSDEKGLIVVHLHPKIENLKLKIICELQNISFCDNKTWCGLLDFEAGLTIVQRTSYPDIQSETELFDRVEEVLGYEDYSLIDECNFYCETIVTYILTGRKLSIEKERYKILHPKRAITAIYIVESFMGFYRNKFAIDIVYQMYSLLSALIADDQDYYYHLSNIISCIIFFMRMYFYYKKTKEK